MCGRFVQCSAPDVYASGFEPESLCEANPHYNLAPTQVVLAVRRSDSGKRELVRCAGVWCPARPRGRTAATA